MCLRYSRVKSMLHEPDDPLMVRSVEARKVRLPGRNCLFDNLLPIRLDHLEDLLSVLRARLVGGNTEVLPKPESGKQRGDLHQAGREHLLAHVPAVRCDPPGAVRPPAAPRQVDQRHAQLGEPRVLLNCLERVPGVRICLHPDNVLSFHGERRIELSGEDVGRHAWAPVDRQSEPPTIGVGQFSTLPGARV